MHQAVGEATIYRGRSVGGRSIESQSIKANLSAAIYRRPFCQGRSSAADLSGTNLSRAYLPRAYQSGPYRGDLSAADLSRADLSRANLSGADLSAAYLSGADLSAADLSAKPIYGADLGDQWIIQGQHRSDGYPFFLQHHDRRQGTNGESRLPLSCMAEAEAHWSKTRGGTKLFDETTANIRAMVDVMHSRLALNTTAETA
jgi:hypothetical protein